MIDRSEVIEISKKFLVRYLTIYTASKIFISIK